MPWPRIVADALLHVDARAADWAIALDPPDRLGDILRQLAAPERSAQLPPAFLYPDQVDAWRRTMHALAAWNGCVLTEAVGRGKSWIAIAVAARTRGGAVAIVPAILRPQWRAVAASAGVPLTVWSHERLSRGLLPPGDPRLVIIDEAHRFRNPGTRRVATISPWLVGRQSLLLTATPIVNRAIDLLSLIDLFAPDDALALDGIHSLTEALALTDPPAALRRLVIRSPRPAAPGSGRRAILMTPGAAEEERARRAAAAIDTLALSGRRSVGRLIRVVLLDAAASSDAAWFAALRRYRALLLQSRDAGGLPRAALRHFAGAALEQLVLWPMVATPAPDADLQVSDLEPVERMLAEQSGDDQWMSQIRSAIGDSLITICFGRHRTTTEVLRRYLGAGTAWVTGAEAGIGLHRLDRDIVLSAFGPARSQWIGRRVMPTILVATDVAAEGLDLQAAGRIVHLDLPWTAVRLAQREGRLLRLGQRHASVEVIVRRPATPFVLALRATSRLRTKSASSARFIRSLSAADPERATRLAIAVSVGHDNGEMAEMVVFRAVRGGRTGLLRLCRTPKEAWCVDELIAVEIARRVELAHAGSVPESALRQLVRESTRGASAVGRTSSRGDAVLTARVHALARMAAGRRDGVALSRLDRLLRLVATSPTAGMRVLFEQLRAATDREFVATPIPLLPVDGPLVLTPLAVVQVGRDVELLFRSGTPPLRCLDGTLRHDPL